MKTLLQHTFLLLLLAFTAHTAQAQVAINEENFPDVGFRAYLLAQDYGADGILTQEEIAGITKIAVSGKSISSLKGIEYFTALQYLDCSYNNLKTLDVSNCTALTTLYCNNSDLNTLDVSNCTALETLRCSNNQLTTLDLSSCTALITLNCSGNLITTLDASNCTELITLNCSSNLITTLNASNCTALIYLYCNNNQLTELDVSNNTALHTLYCGENQLTELDISKNTALTNLQCCGNQLTALSLQGLNLYYLECNNNQLTTLNVQDCTKLKDLDCQNNYINGAAMDALIASMPSNSGGEIGIIDLSSHTEGNVCTTTQVAAAKAKRWNVYAYNGTKWIGYAGSSDPTGIRNVEADTQEDAPYYTIDGKRMAGNPAQKGLYIRNGKKFVAK